MVEGRVEEPLDLSRVQVDADHTVGPRRGEHVRHQLGRDRLAPGRLAVLARVPVVRAHRGDALGRRPLGRVDHDQLLHERVVHGAGVGLDDEDVAAADGDVVLAVDLPVGELAQVGLAQLDAQMPGDVVGPGPGGRARTPARGDAAGSAPRSPRYCAAASRRGLPALNDWVESLAERPAACLTSGPPRPYPSGPGPDSTVCGLSSTPSATSAPGSSTLKGPTRASAPIVARVHTLSATTRPARPWCRSARCWARSRPRPRRCSCPAGSRPAAGRRRPPGGPTAST